MKNSLLFASDSVAVRRPRRQIAGQSDDPSSWGNPENTVSARSEDQTDQADQSTLEELEKLLWIGISVTMLAPVASSSGGALAVVGTVSVISAAAFAAASLSDSSSLSRGVVPPAAMGDFEGA